MTRRTLLCLSLLVSLLLPCGAAASSQRAHRPPARSARHSSTAHRAGAGKISAKSPVTLALAVAERYWSAVPCGGRVSIVADQPIPAEMSSATDGWVTFDSSLGVNDLLAPATTYTQCTISLAHWQWPTATSMRQDWNMFCLTVTHELGHLLGYQHSLVPGSVMAPVFTNESSVPALCKSSRR